MQLVRSGSSGVERRRFSPKVLSGIAIGIIVVGLLLIVTVRASGLLVMRVNGDGMLPTMGDGTRFLTSKAAEDMNAIRRGSIVVFEDGPGYQPQVKRIVGLPGEQIAFKSGDALVNGTALQETYVLEPTRCGGDGYCSVSLGDGEYYVLGDNRGNSRDSRIFGAVPTDDIISVVQTRVPWPGDN
jgi:signal peptidase I